MHAGFITAPIGQASKCCVCLNTRATWYVHKATMRIVCEPCLDAVPSLELLTYLELLARGLTASAAYRALSRDAQYAIDMTSMYDSDTPDSACDQQDQDQACDQRASDASCDHREADTFCDHIALNQVDGLTSRQRDGLCKQAQFRLSCHARVRPVRMGARREMLRMVRDAMLPAIERYYVRVQLRRACMLARTAEQASSGRDARGRPVHDIWPVRPRVGSGYASAWVPLSMHGDAPMRRIRWASSRATFLP